MTRSKRQTNKAPACPRVPVCLLDERRAGIPVEILPWNDGESFALVGLDAARPLAKRKRQASAEALLEAADEELRRSAGVVSAEELEQRRQTRVITPQRPHGEPAHYAVVEAAQLVASHDPQTFAADARYPEDLNERDYRAQPDEQRKVLVGAQTLDPALLLTDTPTAVDGPPIVTSGVPLVLGGNGRSMMLKRAYGVSSPARESNPMQQRPTRERNAIYDESDPTGTGYRKWAAKNRYLLEFIKEQTDDLGARIDKIEGRLDRAGIAK